MLNHLKLNHVGPAPKMQFEFAPRINVLTGNNSLGKTFVLEVASWVPTQSWPGKDPKKRMAWPLTGKRKEAGIGYSYEAKTKPVPRESRFDAKKADNGGDDKETAQETEKPLICQAGSAEAFVGSAVTGREHFDGSAYGENCQMMEPFRNACGAILQGMTSPLIPLQRGNSALRSSHIG